jgi:hypothetical protein
MNAVSIDLPPSVPGIPLEGGFYAGRILISGILYALIAAPKAEGERKAGAWSKSYDSVPGALSWNDGAANTAAMAESGSTLAKWAKDLTIGGYSDWYIPALDELEICYRYLKPTAEPNYLWSRSGINVSAVPPTYPYTAELPAQTQNDLFVAGGSEAFADEIYWSSTQLASDSHYAWGQDFSYGSQDYWGKDVQVKARAVRRLAI